MSFSLSLSEKTWFASTDSSLLLAFIQDFMSDRQCWLIAAQIADFGIDPALQTRAALEAMWGVHERCLRQDKDDANARGQRRCDLFRDIFGNPFHPIVLEPRWRTSTVVDLATAIYEENAFDRMPILADALMEAGCDSDDIISHCRSDGPHVRGCWVVDLIPGKE